MGLRSVPSPARAAQAARSLTGTLSPGAGRLLSSAVPASVSAPAGGVRLVSVLESWTLAATLPVDVDHPESQGSLVRSWKPVCSLVGDAVSGAVFAPFPSPRPPAASRGWARPQPATSSLVFAQSFVLGTGG